MHHYTLQTKFTTRTAQGNTFIDLLQKAYQYIAYTQGCHLYLINQDTNNADCIWVTELWDSTESYQESLLASEGKELLARAIPLLAKEPERLILKAIAGKGLV